MNGLAQLVQDQSFLDQSHSDLRELWSESNLRRLSDPGWTSWGLRFASGSVSMEATLRPSRQTALDLDNFTALTAEENRTSKPWRSGLSERQTNEYHGIMAAFLNVCSRWKLETSDMPMLLGYLPDFSHSISSILGCAPQTRDLIDRVTYLTLISMGLGALFNEHAESEIKWLNTEKNELNSETPLAHMRKGHMQNLITIKSLVTRERGL